MVVWVFFSKTDKDSTRVFNNLFSNNCYGKYWDHCNKMLEEKRQWYFGTWKILATVNNLKSIKENTLILYKTFAVSNFPADRYFY